MALRRIGWVVLAITEKGSRGMLTGGRTSWCVQWLDHPWLEGANRRPITVFPTEDEALLARARAERANHGWQMFVLPVSQLLPAE